LTIPAGTTLSFTGNYSLKVSGTLTVTGTSASRAVFTSANAAPARGNWGGIELRPGVVNVTIDYATIEWASSGIWFNGGSGTVTNSILRNSNYGIFVEPNNVAGVHANLSGGNEITANGHGVYARNIGSPLDPAKNPVVTAKNGAIFGNSTWAVTLDNYGTPHSLIFDFTGNWWGTTDQAQIELAIRHAVDLPILPRIDVLGFRESASGPAAFVILAVSTTPQEIRPLEGQTTTISYTLNAPASVKLEVQDLVTNLKVYEATNVHASFGQYSFVWNGRDQSNAIVPGVSYRGVLIATSGSQTHTFDPTSGGIGSGSGVIPPSYKPFRNEFFKIEYDNVSPGFVRMLTQQQPSGVIFYPINWRYLPAGKTWLYWDGRDASGAIATTSINVFFDPPNIVPPHFVAIAGTRPTISGTGSVPNIEVKTDPYLITHSYEQFTRFAYRIDMDSYVTVKLLPPGIYDPANSQAIILVDNALKQARDAGSQPIDHWVEWRGYAASSTNDILTKDEGSFTLSIEARSQLTNVTTLYRAALEIRK
jgi:hypothetical protein